VQAQPLLQCDLPVLILGETGSGKSRLAQWLHTHSMRRDGPFQIRGAGDLHEESLSAELFGYVKGAFTGADEDREGLFRACDGGTLVLDDIDTLSMEAQRRLLHVLENGWVTPLGAPDRRSPVDVRIIATANTDIGCDSTDEAFRSDLYYRLATICIRMPALRNRSDDIAKLVLFYQNAFRDECPKLDKGQEIQPDAIRLMQLLVLPGNNRELRSAVYTLMLKAATADVVEINVAAATNMLTSNEMGHDYLKGLRQKVRRDDDLLEKLLQVTNHNKRLTARLSGFSHQAIYNKCRAYGWN